MTFWIAYSPITDFGVPYIIELIIIFVYNYWDDIHADSTHVDAHRVVLNLCWRVVILLCQNISKFIQHINWALVWRICGYYNNIDVTLFITGNRTEEAHARSEVRFGPLQDIFRNLRFLQPVISVFYLILSFLLLFLKNIYVHLLFAVCPAL